MERERLESSPDRFAFLWESKARIDFELRGFIKKEEERIARRWPIAAPLLHHLRGFVERDGKRIRPTLTILSFQCFAGEGDDKIILPSLGTELMHDSFIIHDDLYDDIPGVVGTRRGEKVLHLVYADEFLKFTGGRDSNWEPFQFGKHAAVTGAHILLALGARAIHQSAFPSELKHKAMIAYWNTIEETWLGQGMDILSKGKPIIEIGEEEILTTELSRAGVYTLEFPLHLGAILAGAESETLQALTNYARPVGLAFEIYDDVLGLFGAEGEIGKMQADLAEGKRSLLLQRALEKATPQDRAVLFSSLRQRAPTKEQINKTRQIIEGTGALDYVTQLASRLVTKGKTSLEQLDVPGEYREKLSDIADFVIRREK